MAIESTIINSASAVERRWFLHLLGGFELDALPGGQKLALPGKRERALLAYLALSPQGRQPRRKLAALLWGDATDETLLDNLRTCVWRLRKALGDSEHRLLASDQEDILLDVAAFEIDALNFRRLAGQPGRAALESAATLCRGELLDGLDLDSEEFESWRRMEISRYRDQAVEVLTCLMEQLMEERETNRAIDIGTQILGLDPLHEATARQLMRLYADSGRRGTAIQLYRILREALKKDVDTQPEAETRRVFDAILRTGEEAGINPFPSSDDGETPIAPDAHEYPSGTASLKRRLVVLTATFLVALATGIGWYAYQESRTGRASSSAGLSLPEARATPITIAVLPFDNLSGDLSQQFFSDGMTEEISSALAKVPGLQLFGRTSAFQFKNNSDARQVGRKLGVGYVIEGSVRKNEKRVRITARLIRTDTGLSVWSEVYDRELIDIFAIQENIATAISQALRLSLGKAAEIHLSNRNIDPQSYEQYLRAIPLIRARQTGIFQATEILEPLVERNPEYAPGWALLAYCYALMPALAPPNSVSPFGLGWDIQTHDRTREYWPKAEAAARKAIQLDPNLAAGYLAFGVLEHFRGRLIAADDMLVKALNLDPNSTDALALRMNLLADVGKKQEALAAARLLMALDPYVPTWKQDAAEIYWVGEEYETAIVMLQSLLDRPSGPTSLAMVYASQGRFTEAADVIETSLKLRGEYIQGQSLAWRTTAQLLRTAPAKAAPVPDSLRLGRTDFVYLYVHAPERSLEIYEDDVKGGLLGGHGNMFSYVWHPSYAPARKTERFKALLLKTGMVDYWRQRGWPSFCRPLGSHDFSCT